MCERSCERNVDVKVPTSADIGVTRQALELKRRALSGWHWTRYLSMLDCVLFNLACDCRTQIYPTASHTPRIPRSA
eukprot:273014-Prorocentrum_minimum.AAC.7